MFKIYKSKCNECLFSKNKIVSEDRKKELLKEIFQKDSYFICHKDENKKVCCKGFWDKNKNFFNLGRIVQRLNLIEWEDFKEETKELA